MKKPTLADLMAEIETLKKRIATLEARPPVVINNHPPALHPLYQPHPMTVPQTPFVPTYRPGEEYCGTMISTPAFLSPLWNGPRNPDGSCAPLGSATLTVG